MRLSLRSLTLMTRFSTCCYGQRYPALPQAVSKNAIALVNTNDNTYLLSFMGLGTNKGYQDVHNLVCALALPIVTC
jgi:cephalosporin hydroxylase